MSIVEEEADETLFWLELVVESALIKEQNLTDLMNEAKEILSITVSSVNTARKRLDKNRIQIRNPKSAIRN